MKIHLATSKQLECIVKHDSDCSPSLLREVVEEMLNRNLFDSMINRCFQMVFGSIKRMSEVYKMDLEDFLQIGRTVVYEMIDRYKAGNGKSFSSFAFMVIKQKFSKVIAFLEFQKRDQRNVFSYNDTEEGLEIINVIPNHTNIEKYVINKVTVEKMLKKLSKKQRQIVDLWLQGYIFEEIAEILGCAGKERSLNKTYNDAIKKMRKGA